MSGYVVLRPPLPGAVVTWFVTVFRAPSQGGVVRTIRTKEVEQVQATCAPYRQSCGIYPCARSDRRLDAHHGHSLASA